MDTKNIQIKPVGYFRKSSDNEDRQVLSIESQIIEMKRVAEKMGITDFPMFTESKSAKAPGRTEFNNMIKMIESGRANVIVCWKSDRLARNFIDGGMIIDLLQKGVIQKIVTHEKEYVPSDNVLLMAIEFGVANQYIRDLSANTKRGHRTKAERGYPSGIARIGYLNSKIEEKEYYTWIKDPDRFPLVKQIFQMYLSGKYSVCDIWIHARDVLCLTTPTRKRLGGKPIALSYLYRMLANPIYAGFFYLNDQRYELHTSLERVITEEEYWMIQGMLGKKGRPKSRNSKRLGLYNYLMRGPGGEGVTPDFKFQLICDCKKKFSYLNKSSCPNCGLAVEKIEKPVYLNYVFYYVVKEKKDRTKKAKGIEEKKIDLQIHNYFAENIHISEELSAWCIRHLSELRDMQLNDRISVLKSQDVAEDKIKTKLRGLLDLRISRAGELSDEDEKMFNDKEKDLKRELCEVQKQKKVVDNPFSRIKTIKDKWSLMPKILERLENGSRSERKALLMEFGSNLTLQDGKVSICNVKEVELLSSTLRDLKAKIPGFEPGKIVDTSEQNETFQSAVPTLLRR